MASAFIFLAAKVEEQPKKIEHVIRTYYYFNNRTEYGRPYTEVDTKSQVGTNIAYNFRRNWVFLSTVSGMCIHTTW